jgi:predicted nucleic acid-binding protein
MFCDTSTLAKYYANEEESGTVRTRLDADEVTLSELARVELMSVFHRRFRERIWSRAQFLHIVSQFEQDNIKGAWTWLPIDGDIIKFSTGVYARLPDHVFLRASDCLHIATAIHSDQSEIYTHDDHQAKAAEVLGLTVVRIA